MAAVKILVAGDPASIHANRFMNLLKEIGYDVRIFQSEDYYWQEEHLHDTILYVASFVPPHQEPIQGNILKITHPIAASYSPFNARLFRRIPTIKRILTGRNIPIARSQRLVKVLRSWKPDIVFSLKMQNDGYTVSEAKEQMGSGFKPKWVHFNWGTDIEFFGKHPAYNQEHLPKIRKLLAQCDFHIADCKRDVRQAIEFGLKGKSLGDCPAPGGFDLSTLADIRANSGGFRDIILVKGREGGLVGRAFNVLAALHKSAHSVRDYKIKIIMAESEVKSTARFLSIFDGINYEIMPRLPYRDLLALYAQSRIAISASDVDGTPSFLTEAMAMGAFPIHSDMESVREWVQHEENGLLFPVDDIQKLVACIERSLRDDRLIENARKKNAAITREQLDRSRIREHVRDLMENIVLKGTRTDDKRRWS